MTEIVKATTPAGILRLVPRLVGFRPEESVVLAVFAGARTGHALRVDLPATHDAAHLDRLARHLVGVVCRMDGVTGFLAVVYTAQPFAAVPEALFGALAEHGHAAGLELKGEFCIAGDGWGMPGGRRRPLGELGPLDHPDLLDPAAALRLPEVSAPARDAFRRQLHRWRTRSSGDGGTVHGFRAATAAQGAGFVRGPAFLDRAVAGLDLRALLEGALQPHEPAEEPCPCRAALAALAAVPDLREHLLLHVAWGAAFGERVRRAWFERDEEDPLAAAALAGGEVERPSVPRIEAALEAIRDALAHLDPAERAPLLSSAAWLHWALGRGSLAGSHLDLALAIDPADRFALALAMHIGHGALPEWAYREHPGLSVEEQVRRLA